MDIRTPNYYDADGIDPFAVMKLWDKKNPDVRGYEATCRNTALKYLWRYPEKNGLEDIRKAKHYLDELEKELLRQMSENGN